MNRLILMVLSAAVASAATANESVPRSDVEARLDALEVLNVTEQKAPRADASAPDPQLDAILQAAAQAEAEDAP
jgi:hypothetical protein